MVTRGEGGDGGIEWEFGTDTLLYLKQIINKHLLYSTENSAQYSVITLSGIFSLQLHDLLNKVYRPQHVL